MIYVTVIPHGVPKLPYHRRDGTEQQAVAVGKKVCTGLFRCLSLTDGF